MSENIIIVSSDELYHSGILGMKHGLRRFQYKDGSLTPAGRERYGVGQKRKSKSSEKREIRRAEKRLEKIEKSDSLKDYSKLTDKEKEVAKEKAIREGNVKEAYKNMNEFTYNELNDLKSRYNLNKEIKSINDEDLEKGWRKLEKISNRLNTLSTFTRNGTNLYNDVANILNAFDGYGGTPSGNKLPIINASNNKKNKNNKNNNNNNKNNKNNKK